MTEEQPDRLAEALAADTAPDEVPPPPAELVDRTVQAMAARANADVNPPANRAARWRRAWPLVAALAAGVALVGSGWVALRSRADGFSAGERRVSAQETIRLGQRAVLVAEAGTDLRWQRGDGGVRVEQRAGDVFYRVNAGEFRVQTPAGVVRVTGTCFRVEVSDMKLINRQNLSGAAVGAALGAAVVVTVYEGRVLLAKDQAQGELELRPGERGELSAGGVQRLSAGDPSGTRPALATRPGVPRFDETEALRARIAEQENELAQLRAPGAIARKVEQDKNRFLSASKEELLERAQRCEIRWDTPNIQGVKEKDRQRLGLSETEAAAMNEALNEVKQQVFGELRALYVELTGDPVTAEKLSPETIHNEVFAKGSETARPQARRQLARELAGLAPPPVDLAKTPITERAFRVMMSIGNRYERAVAERLGAQRARALREKEDGWRSKSVANGCE